MTIKEVIEWVLNHINTTKPDGVDVDGAWNIVIASQPGVEPMISVTGATLDTLNRLRAQVTTEAPQPVVPPAPKRETTVFDELIGKRITAVFLDGKELLAFRTSDEQTFGYQCEGGCCSQSWIEHLNGLDALIGRVVNSVVVRELPDLPRTDYDLTQCYGWTLETNAGRFDIEMRNSSNGYYGGWIRAVKLLVPPGPEVTKDF